MNDSNNKPVDKKFSTKTALPEDISSFIKAMIFISSISFLFIAVSVGCTLNSIYVHDYCINTEWQDWYYFYIVYILIAIFGVIFPSLFIRAIRGSNSAQGIIVDVRDKSFEAVPHAVLYLSLFIAHDCSFQQYLWLTVFVIAITVIYCQTNDFSLNPIFLMMGYKFYDVKIEFDGIQNPKAFTLISKNPVELHKSVSINRWSNQPIAVTKEDNNVR